MPANKRFTVADAAQLKLKLQALDDKLEPDANIDTLRGACQGRPFHEEIYMDGSEEFYMLVNPVMRPDLIPEVYIEAYAAVQQGRYHLNQYRVSDFKKGVDPTFSEIRGLLGKIDALCGTKLDESYQALEDEGMCDVVTPSWLTPHSQTLSVPSIASRAPPRGIPPPHAP
jgi:hypothetical protein